MRKPNNYENVQGFTGEFEEIKLGGHICKVIKAEEAKSKAGADMLNVYFDIAEGENKDFYQRQFDNSTYTDKKWANNAIQRFLLEDNQGNCNSFLKGFITSIEKSNEGFIFNFDEATLKGKKFGGVFAREQYKNASGELKMSTKLRFIRSTDGILDVEIPVDKLLPASETVSFASYDESTYDPDSLPF